MMSKEENPSQWGLVSSDGFFQHLSTLNTRNLEYACKSVSELESLLEEKVSLERYEECAVIRDELIKRNQK